MPTPIRRVSCQAVPLWSNQHLQQAQLEDSSISPVVKWVKESRIRPSWSSITPHGEATLMYWAQWDSLHLKYGVVYRLWEAPAENSTVWQLLLPKKLGAEVLQQLHDSEAAGHLGISKTLKRVFERFYWVRCSRDVKQWCKSYDTCATRKVHTELFKHLWLGTTLELQWNELWWMCLELYLKLSPKTSICS